MNLTERFMNLEVTYRDITSTEPIKKHIEEQLSAYLEDLVAKDEHIRLVVSAKDGRHFAELYWHDNQLKKDFFAKEDGDNLYQQIHDVFANISGQVRKTREKLVDKGQRRQPLKKASSQ